MKRFHYILCRREAAEWMINMKKMLSVLMILVICASLFAGCGAKEKSAEPAAQSAGLANPIEEVTPEEQVERTGFVLDPPEGAEDVRRTTINQGDGSYMAQLDFVYEGTEYYYRVQPTGEFSTYDMSGLYYEWKNVEDASVLYCEAKVYTCDKAGYISWLDVVPGVNYNLGTAHEGDSQKLIDMANLIFKPVQGEC